MTEQETLDNAILRQFFDLASVRNLGTLLQKALEISTEFFHAEAGSIFFHATPPESHQIGSLPDAILSHTDQVEQVVARRLQTGTWRVIDTSKPAISVHKHPEHGLLSVNTPILRNTQVVGSLSLILSAERPLSSPQRAVLAYLAQGVGQLGALTAELAMTQKRYNELELLHQTSQVLATTLDTTEVLENVMHLTANVLDAGAASILLIDEQQHELVFEISHGPRRELLYKQRVSLNEGVVGWVARHNRPLIVNDVTRDPRFSRKVDARTGFLTLSIAAVPLKLKKKVIGVLEALNKQADRGFDDNDLRLMTSIAAQAAVALENAKLYQNLREERDKIITVQEKERHALSRILHDGTVQQLSAISMNLDYLRKLIKIDPEAAYKEIDKIQELVHKGIREARLILFELRPILLETKGLVPTLERYVDQLDESLPFQVEADLSPLPIKLDRNVAGTIFSIIQEAVNNAKRHAKASILKITLSTEKNTLLVLIKDNGLGFDLGQVEAGYAGRNSLGLLNMKERATLIDGHLTIESETKGPATGTTVCLTLPLRNNYDKK